MKFWNLFTSGIFIAIIGIVLFSAKAVMVKLAYKYQVTTLHLLLFRMLFSVPFYLVIAYFYQSKKKDKTPTKDYLWLVSLVLLGII